MCSERMIDGDQSRGFKRHLHECDRRIEVKNKPDNSFVL